MTPSAPNVVYETPTEQLTTWIPGTVVHDALKRCYTNVLWVIFTITFVVIFVLNAFDVWTRTEPEYLVD